eukprot:TRINITY_DN35855_c0_g1_i1.p1 TRINITY_DN35855_c0_g1~~TRINITY_DN35855_c0_g1_i1.p1  ORF type:complete len:291 (+),score=8.35 TRINITY_DN35855_c0_g1_i1:54-926(+)
MAGARPLSLAALSAVALLLTAAASGSAANARSGGTTTKSLSRRLLSKLPHLPANTNISCIIVLGHELQKDGTAPQVLVMRARTAALLQRVLGMNTPVIATGGMSRGVGVESTVLRELLKSSGVPSRTLHLETESQNTFDNALYTLPLMRELACTNAGLVTSDFHMPRASYVFDALFADRGGRERVIAVPSPSGHRVAPARTPRPWESGLDVTEWTRSERAEYDRRLLLTTVPGWLSNHGVRPLSYDRLRQTLWDLNRMCDRPLDEEWGAKIMHYPFVPAGSGEQDDVDMD